jgi:hypothetical protein
MIIPTEVVNEMLVGGIAVVGQSCLSVLKKGILVGRASFETKQNVIPLRVVNASDAPQMFSKGLLQPNVRLYPVRTCYLLKFVAVILLCIT